MKNVFKEKKEKKIRRNSWEIEENESKKRITSKTVF